MKKEFIDGRIHGGYSIHEFEDKSKCTKESCPSGRCVDCCSVSDGLDILECWICGRQWSVKCFFDEEYS